SAARRLTRNSRAAAAPRCARARRCPKPSPAANGSRRKEWYPWWRCATNEPGSRMTQRIDPHLWQRHAWMNRLEAAVLGVVLAALLATVGWLLWGEDGILYMLVFCAVSLLLQPLAGPELVLRLYRAQPIAPGEAPELHAVVERLAARAGLPRRPRLYF